MSNNVLRSHERIIQRPRRISRDPLQNESFGVRLVVVLKIVSFLTIGIYGAIFLVERYEHIDDSTRHGYNRVKEIVRADPRMGLMVERAMADGRMSSYEFRKIKDKNREFGND